MIQVFLMQVRRVSLSLRVLSLRKRNYNFRQNRWRTNQKTENKSYIFPSSLLFFFQMNFIEVY